MTRLHYDKVSKRHEGVPQMNFETDFENNAPKGYLEKIAKLVPTEIIIGYISLVNFVPLLKYDPAKIWVYIFVFVLCLILTPVYLNVFSEKNKPKRNHLIVSSISFIVWAYAISGKTILVERYDPALSSILLISFSLISGVIPLKK